MNHGINCGDAFESVVQINVSYHRRSHVIGANMNKRFALICVFLSLIASTLACQAATSNGVSTTPSGSLFEDDFSDPSSGWPSASDETGITDYLNGEYQIRVDIEEYDLWATAGLNFSDVRIQVDAIKASGTDDNDFGVICRHRDEDNFYAFVISSDGFYGIVKVKDGSYSLLDMESMETSDKIRTGRASNHIQAECIGQDLKLYINGTLTMTRQDADITSGDVGLLAGTFSEAGTDIRFDNFQVSQP